MTVLKFEPGQYKRSKDESYYRRMPREELGAKGQVRDRIYREETKS